jgi:hypothetical protein
VDSFIKTRPGNSSYEKIIAVSKLQREVTPTTKELMKAYSVNDGMIDSAYFYYATYLRDVPFSFSRQLDSLHHSKLHKVELLMKMDTSKYAISFNKYRKITWQLSEQKNIDNKDEIIQFLKKVDQQYKADQISNL